MVGVVRLVASLFPKKNLIKTNVPTLFIMRTLFEWIGIIAVVLIGKFLYDLSRRWGYIT